MLGECMALGSEARKRAEGECNFLLEKNLIKTYLEGWKLFNRYAFEWPDIYYRLFWGQYNNEFADAMQEYFELFPFSGSEKYPAYYYTMLFSDNIQERDFLMLHRAVGRKLLTEEDAAYYSRTTPLIVKGMLGECMALGSEARKRAEGECNFLLEKNLERITMNGLSN
jgi:predicted HicB family RNase H-like nuclease